MSLTLSVFLLLMPAGTPEDDDKSVIPERIAASIEKNYAKLECFIATCKLDHTYFNVKKYEEIITPIQGGGFSKQVLRPKITGTIIYYVVDDHFKIVHQTPEGKLTSSLAKFDGIFDQYHPADEKEPPMAWKRRLDQMPGMILDDPRSFGLNALEEDYPKLLRTSEIISVRKKDGEFFDILLKRTKGPTSLITFSSAVNFLPVRIVNIFRNNPSDRIQYITYEKHGEIWFFKSFQTKITNKKFANIDELDAEKTDLKEMRIQSLANLKLNNRSLLPPDLFSTAYPKGTIIRDALINQVYTVGNDK